MCVCVCLFVFLFLYILDGCLSVTAGFMPSLHDNHQTEKDRFCLLYLHVKSKIIFFITQ